MTSSENRRTHMIPNLKAAIQRFIRETDALIEAQPVGRNEVFHIHVEMFPLTRIHEESAAP